MLQGVCVDPGQTAVLENGKQYFLFPNGPTHYYVSIFPNPNAHKGCFQSRYFQIVEKVEWPQEPVVKSVSLDPEKMYQARLVWRKPGYKMVALKEYYIKPRTTHCDFYHDSSLNKLAGCFPIHWFDEFKEVQLEETVHEIEKFESDVEEIVPFFSESEPKSINYEQLSIFDF